MARRLVDARLRGAAQSCANLSDAAAVSRGKDERLSSNFEIFHFPCVYRARGACDEEGREGGGAERRATAAQGIRGRRGGAVSQ